MSRAPIRGTRGLGIGLLISAAILTAVGMLAIAQLNRSSGVLHEATRDAGGALVEEIACSAIEEALFKLQSIVTDPDEPLFWQLRRELIRGKRAALDLSHDLDPALVRERLKKARPGSPLAFVNLERFVATFHVPVVGGCTDQYLDLDVAASLPVAGHSTYRRVCQRRRYGFTLVSTYKPFDQLTFAILQHSGIDAVGREVSRLTDALVNFNMSPTLATALRSRLGTDARGAEEMPLTIAPPFVPLGPAPSIPGWLNSTLNKLLADRRQRSGDFDEMLASLEPDERSWYYWTMLLQRPEARVRVVLSRTFLPPPSRPLTVIPQSALSSDVPNPGTIVFSTQDKENLADFDYEARMRKDYRGSLQEGLSKISRLNRFWVQYITQEPTRLGESGTRQFLQELEDMALESREGLGKTFKSINTITRHLVDHTRLGFRVEALDGYVHKSTHRLRSLCHHLSRPEDMASFLREYPTYCGHVAYYGAKPVRVRQSTFSGKMILSTPAKDSPGESPLVTIDDLRVKDPTSDLVVLEIGRLELPGSRVDASVFCRDRLYLTGDVSIQGNLILERLLPLKERRNQEELRGSVTYSPAVWSGPIWERTSLDEKQNGLALDHYVLTLCPRDTRRVILRNREGRW